MAYFCPVALASFHKKFTIVHYGVLQSTLNQLEEKKSVVDGCQVDQDLSKSAIVHYM